VAKGKRKANRPAGVNPQELRQQRLEARREAKARAEAARRKAQQRARLIRMLMLALLAVGLFWFVFLRGRAPTEIGGHPVQTFSQAGVGDHTDGTVQYPTTPPVSGTHAAFPGVCGVFAEQIPNETQVHNLEHGAVGIQYVPELPPEQIQAIEEIARGYSENVFSAPYPGMETPIAVTSWGRMMRLQELDEDAIREYIDAFAGEGPEPGQTCPNDSDQPFDASPSPASTGSPVPTVPPEATASPGGGNGGNDGDGGGGDG